MPDGNRQNTSATTTELGLIQTIEQMEAAILTDVATRFFNFKESTPRYDLLVKFKNPHAWQAIASLLNRNIIRRTNMNSGSAEEEYLPTAMAFQFSNSAELRNRARLAATVVLEALHQISTRERRREGFGFDDLKRRVVDIYPNRMLDDETLRFGIYLARDLNVLAGYKPPDGIDVTWFQIGENAISMVDAKSEWDRVMSAYKKAEEFVDRGEEKREAAQTQPASPAWERIEPLGKGGQSDVFLVRSPARTIEREACLQKLRTALDQNQKSEFPDAIWSYSRPETTAELGAMKIFKIRKDSDEKQALARLTQEIQILKQNRPGLPKLLDSNEEERWIVTEYFPEGTLEDNILCYKGKPALALKAFLSLVNIVTDLHDEGIVHRDIKPANVFVRRDDELVLGDFGIVFLPDQPARLTRTNESVGPHDFMPPWADKGGRLEKVESCFDVYSLGKLLWCMVTGRLVLKREWFTEPENDVSLMFRHDPHVYMINQILEKCVVDKSNKCMGIHEMRAMVIAFVNLIEQGGQLLHDGIPRPCHVCGSGEYKPERLQSDKSIGKLRIWTGGSDTVSFDVETFTCDRCGHVQFFKTS